MKFQCDVSPLVLRLHCCSLLGLASLQKDAVLALVACAQAAYGSMVLSVLLGNTAAKLQHGMLYMVCFTWCALHGVLYPAWCALQAFLPAVSCTLCVP